MENGLTPEQFISISEKLKKVQEDTTPIAIVNDGKVTISGDANKTEVKKNDYEIKFRVPKDLLESAPDGAQEIGDFYIFTVEYKGITITPRNDLKIADAAIKLKPFFHKLKDNGDIGDLDNEELLSILACESDEIHLAIYRLVGTFLGVDDITGEYMLPFSVIGALFNIINNHPEMFNKADVFFG